MLRPLWQKITRFNPAFGLLLVLAFGIPRFIIALNANVTGNYGLIAIVFLLMWIAPFILLTKNGRRSIGLKKPTNYYWLLYSFFIGIGFCALMYFAATLFYDHTLSNWFVYISKSYTASGKVIPASEKLIYFIIFAATAITFSPIGEELFYRGVAHGGFATGLGERRASIADSTAFALTHLAHFGIVYISGTWHFFFVPALLWVIFMFVASRLFFLCKEKSGSLAGAVICHASYNLAMTYFIFYYIL